MKTEEAIGALIARMPARVRDHVAKLGEEIASLKKAADARMASPTRIMLPHWSGKDEKNSWLPDDTRIRFTLDSERGDYVDVELDRQDSTQIVLRGDSSPLVLLPHAGNMVNVRRARWERKTGRVVMP